MGKKKTEKIDDVIFTPNLFKHIQMQGGVTFREPQHIITGDGYVKVIHIYKLPHILRDFWLENLTRDDDTIVTVDVATRDIIEVKTNINKAITEENIRERYASSYDEFYDAQERQNQLKAMYEEIASFGEVIKMLHFRIFVSGTNLDKLEKKVGDMIAHLQASEYGSTVLLNEAKYEWQSMYRPYRKQMEKFTLEGLSLKSSQIAGGYPFRFSSMQDDGGNLLGFTNCGGVVLFNEFLKDSKRKYYNTLTVGTMGSGKSTFLKKRFRARAEVGDYVRCFDISGEFNKLTEEFGGTIISCDGTNAVLNPLEILKSGDDEQTNYARHLQKVTTFFQCLYPSITNKQIVVLQNELRGLYESFKLTPNLRDKITGLPAKEYPIFSDLHNFIRDNIDKKYEEAVNVDETKRAIIVDDIKDMKELLDIVNNTTQNYGFIFNKHTDIVNLTFEKIVNFDISSIKDLGNVFVAQLFNMVYFCWDNAVWNGSIMKEKYENGEIEFEDIERFLILIDESHRWISIKYPYILDMVTIILREGRKYFAGVTLASQSIRDYAPEGTSEKELEKLRVVFELTQYKFIFQQDTSVLPLIDNLFGSVLSPWQRNKIPTLEMGETILAINGDKNIFFKVWLSKDYEQGIFSGGA